MRGINQALFALVIAAAAAVPSIAQPLPERSQHPRIGALATLMFASDSDALRWGANRKLGRVAAWAAANPDGIIVLEGHTDPRGSRAYNRDLGLRRALTVKRELAEAGVPDRQIVIAAYGEEGPRRGTNRRVSIWATRTAGDAVTAFIRSRGSALVLRGDEVGDAIAIESPPR
jgi:outer membrane protein OmpA-like peptidoglycan-associated protein